MVNVFLWKVLLRGGLHMFGRIYCGFSSFWNLQISLSHPKSAPPQGSLPSRMDTLRWSFNSSLICLISSRCEILKKGTRTSRNLLKKGFGRPKYLWSSTLQHGRRVILTAVNIWELPSWLSSHPRVSHDWLEVCLHASLVIYSNKPKKTLPLPSPGSPNALRAFIQGKESTFRKLRKNEALSARWVSVTGRYERHMPHATQNCRRVKSSCEALFWTTWRPSGFFFGGSFGVHWVFHPHPTEISQEGPAFLLTFIRDWPT